MTRSLSKSELSKLIQHREPMLLIDEINKIKKETSETAIENVTTKACIVIDHLLYHPVMAGGLLPRNLSKMKIYGVN